MSATACGGGTDLGVHASDGGSDGVAPTCNATAIDGIVIATTSGPNPLDPLGYPPYAIDGCTLVYVAASTAPSNPGALVQRDLTTGSETVLDAASASPRRPSIAGDMVAWEVSDGIVVRKGATARRLTSFMYPVGEPRATNDAVVFTAWLQPHGDTDVYLWIPDDPRGPQPIATGPGEQRFADVSDAFVAVSDFSEDPTGAFDENRLSLADIVVFDRATLTKTVRHLPGKQAFPMLGRGGRLGYLDWDVIHPEPKLSQWTLRVGGADQPPTGDVNVKGSGTVMTSTPYVRPSVHGAFVEWVDETTGTSGLFRRPLDLSAPATTALTGSTLYGPVAGGSVTAIATQVGSAISLRGVAR